MFNQKSSSKFHTEQSCDRLKFETSAAQKKKKKKHVKKTAFRSGFPICHKLWDIDFFFFSLIGYSGIDYVFTAILNDQRVPYAVLHNINTKGKYKFLVVLQETQWGFTVLKFLVLHEIQWGFTLLKFLVVLQESRRGFTALKFPVVPQESQWGFSTVLKFL